MGHVTGAHLATLTEHADAVFTGAAFSADGRTVAYTSGDNTVLLWDVARRTAVARLTGHTEQVHPLAYAPGGRRFVTAGADHTVTLWNTDPHQVAGRTCAGLGRGLIRSEWRHFIPELTYRQTC